MDLETLNTLGPFLLWGGLILLMMRYGCCSHLLRGRGRHGHGPTGDAAPAGEVKDPVCGMGVDPKNAAAAAVRGGTTHYFCSVSCRDRFEQPAEQIANGSGQSGHQHG